MATAAKDLSTADRWDSIEHHLEAVSDHLREIRGEVEERVELVARKLQAARKVLGD